MPGLVDMHTHMLSDDDFPDAFAEDELKIMVANGVTTIRFMIGTPEQLVLRARSAKNEIIAPTIFSASPHLTGREQGNDFVVNTPDEARDAVRKSKAAGYDFIKVTTFIKPEVYESAVDEAGKIGIRVVGHADSRFVGVERAWKAKQQIEHLDGYMELLVRDASPVKGSVSDLFLAESADIGGVVVLKVTAAIRKETGVDQSMERFLQEFEILREIKHPNVVQIYDLGVTDDHLFLAMEHFARGDLRKRMAEGLTARQSLAYAHDMALALQAIHEVGIFHRDLKPGNVMLRDDGSIALIDFGLAKHVALKMEVTDKGLIFGTPHYMSPEQGHGKPIDARSDIYALGVMLYEMLTGKKPFDADNHMAILVHHAKAPIPKLPERIASLQPLIDTLMAKDAKDRPADADTAAKLMEFALDALGAPETPS